MNLLLKKFCVMLTLLGVGLLSVMGCQGQTKKEAGGDGNGGGVKPASGTSWHPNSPNNGVDMVKIRFNLKEQDAPRLLLTETDDGLSLASDPFQGEAPQDFALTQATKYTILVDSCLSGYTATATENSGGTLSLVLHDKNCLAKLTAFSVGADDYTPTGGTNFTTWLAGNTAVFVNTVSGKKLNMQVVSQISTPLDPNNDVVAYTFSDIKTAPATTTVTEGQYSDGIAITVDGKDAPAYTIKSVTWTGLTAGGGGIFEFILECPAAIAAGKCNGQTIQGSSYQLIEFGANKTCADISAEAATSLFITGSPSTIAAGEVLAADATPYNGGFTTKTGGSALTGPNEMYNHRGLQLLFQALTTDGGGIRCFNITIAPITQN